MQVGNWVLDPGKYLAKEDAITLLACARRNAERAGSPEQKVAVRDYFIVHLGLTTGLRVMEMAALHCGDVFLREGVSSVLVRSGKGKKKRMVFFGEGFRKHCEDYLGWKQRVGESVESEQPLLRSSATGSHLSTRALQKAFKRCAKRAGISASYSIHCLRHTYACFLLKASGWNLRLVQKQLGHSRLSTTQVYADVMMPDIEKAVNALYQ
ncbi:hypothetical protein LCGC14_2859910 [marine sediment metagenome]|uniref:Tyr recombinase domain-containing protein n=1 Tax=marine sediment metagenome TaxID=412755 RepID=A0A0F8YSN6_9ZZZZ